MSNAQLTHTFYIQGMHCAACEILIREILNESEIIKEYSFPAQENKVDITFSDERLQDKDLALAVVKKLFADTEYTFTLEPVKKTHWQELAIGAVLALAIIFLVRFLGEQNIIPEPSLNNNSSLAAFFIFGVLASISSCAALVGGIILSLASAWFKENQPKWQPIASFQIGRIVGFAVGGLVLGFIGSFFQVSPILNSILLILVSVLMIVAGLDFMGLRIWQRLFKNYKLPKFISTNHGNSIFWPTLVGVATFIIPCGFTSTVQLVALSTQSPFQATLIMLAFVLGTVPALSLIAFFGSLWQGKKTLNYIIGYAVGILIIILGVNNLSSQLALLGLPNLSDISVTSNSATPSSPTTSSDDLVPMDGEVQVIKLTATTAGYKPSRLKIRANTPTRLEIDVQGVSGCSNAIIAPDFFEGRINLVKGETPVKEFTSPAPGNYQITCWMRMITVNVEVI